MLTPLFCLEPELEEFVFQRGEQNAGAAGLAPDAMVKTTRFGSNVITRMEFFLIDPELAMQEV